MFVLGAWAVDQSLIEFMHPEQAADRREGDLVQLHWATSDGLPSERLSCFGLPSTLPVMTHCYVSDLPPLVLLCFGRGFVLHATVLITLMNINFSGDYCI